MKLPVEPILLEPYFEEKIWGGNKLKTLLNKKIPEGVPIGESWEVSAFPNKESYIKEGTLSGENLRSLYEKFPEEILGTSHKKHPTFPLLIKFIDAKEKLSIQVHPKGTLYDSNSFESNSLAEKNECWFIVNSGNKGSIATGLNKKVTKEELLQAIKDKTIAELLNIVTVKEGEAYFLPAGTIHAILGDVIIYEVQQASNITFRLYDWDRVNSPEQRPLQLKEALEVADFSGKKDFLAIPKLLTSNPFYSRTLRISCNHFIVEEYMFHKESTVRFQDNSTLKIITTLNSSFYVEWERKTKEIPLGSTLIIPAVLKDFTIIGSEKCKIIISTIPSE